MAECKHPAAFVAYGINGGCVCGICGAKVEAPVEKKPEDKPTKKGGKK